MGDNGSWRHRRLNLKAVVERSETERSETERSETERSDWLPRLKDYATSKNHVFCLATSLTLKAAGNDRNAGNDFPQTTSSSGDNQAASKK